MVFHAKLGIISASLVLLVCGLVMEKVADYSSDVGMESAEETAGTSQHTNDQNVDTEQP